MTDDRQLNARRHLWGHFTNLHATQRSGVPVISRGEGPWIFDDAGRRYLDGLSGLFTVNIGHGRHELAEVAAQQAESLAYFPIWSFAHEPAIDLATRLADLAPGDLDRGRQDAQHGLADHRLARAGFPHQPPHLARRHAERDASQQGRAVLKPDREVADGQVAHLSTGSKRSFSPSPSCEKDRTVRKSVMSGKTSTHQA